MLGRIGRATLTGRSAIVALTWNAANAPQRVAAAAAAAAAAGGQNLSLFTPLPNPPHLSPANSFPKIMLSPRDDGDGDDTMAVAALQQADDSQLYVLDESGCTSIYNKDGLSWTEFDGRDSYRRLRQTGALEYYGGAVVTARKSSGPPAPRMQLAFGVQPDADDASSVLQPLGAALQQLSLEGREGGGDGGGVDDDVAAPLAVPDITQSLAPPTELPQSAGAEATAMAAATTTTATSSPSSTASASPPPAVAAPPAPASGSATVAVPTPAPTPAALGPRPVLLLTNQISENASPADSSTNAKYTAMMRCIDRVLRNRVDPNGSRTTTTTITTSTTSAGSSGGSDDGASGQRLEPVHWEHRLFEDEIPTYVEPANGKQTATFATTIARKATDNELTLEGTHTDKYLKAMARRTVKAAKKGGLLESGLASAGCTSVTETAARAAAASLIDASVAVLHGEYQSAFVMCRPPSHHAVGNAGRARGASQKDSPFGFCHINSISAAVAAVRAAALQAAGPPRKGGGGGGGGSSKAAAFPKIAIIDVDVHPGNGNEDTWYNDPSVLHINMFEKGIWPGGINADPKAKGAGVGKGFNVNIPMIQGDGNDAYSYAVNHYVLPTVTAFQPTMIFIACGFDALAGDPYASMGLTPVWFAWLAARLKEEEIAPVVFNLEGGYGPEQCGVAADRVIDGLSGVGSAYDYVDEMGIAADPTEDRGAFGVAYPANPTSRSFIDQTWNKYHGVQALEMLVASKGQNDPGVARAYATVGFGLVAQGHLMSAAAAFGQALEVMEAEVAAVGDVGASSLGSAYGDVLYQSALMHEQEGSGKLALDAMRKAAEAYQAYYGEDDDVTIEAAEHVKRMCTVEL